MNSRMPIRKALLRALVLTILTFGAGVFLYMLMGVTFISSVLFAPGSGMLPRDRPGALAKDKIVHCPPSQVENRDF